MTAQMDQKRMLGHSGARLGQLCCAMSCCAVLWAAPAATLFCRDDQSSAARSPEMDGLLHNPIQAPHVGGQERKAVKRWWWHGRRAV